MVLPLLRADRGTPGRLALNLVPVHAGAVASRARVAVHQLARFAPLFAAIALGQVGLLGVAVVALLLLAAGLVAAELDPGRRSLAGLLAGTTTATFAGAGIVQGWRARRRE